MGVERRRDLGDPVTERAPRELDALPREDAREAVQREMIEIFRDDDVREQPFAGERLLDRLRRRRRFDHALVTVRACVLGAHRLDHDETGGLVLELLGDRFADPGLRVAARALLVGVGHVDLDASARQVRGQWSPPRRASPLMPAHRRVPRVHLDRLGDRARLVGELLKRQLQLPRIHAFGFLAEQPLTEHVELMAERGVLALRLRQLVLQRG